MVTELSLFSINLASPEMVSTATQFNVYVILTPVVGSSGPIGSKLPMSSSSSLQLVINMELKRITKNLNEANFFIVLDFSRVDQIFHDLNTYLN